MNLLIVILVPRAPNRHETSATIDAAVEGRREESTALLKCRRGVLMVSCLPVGFAGVECLLPQPAVIISIRVGEQRMHTLASVGASLFMHAASGACARQRRQGASRAAGRARLV